VIHDANGIARRWLLMVHQLPSEPSSVRVRTWRQLQQLGAVSIKQAVYVLPDSPPARDAFIQIRADIASAGGQASVFASGSVDGSSDDALVEAFRRSRERDYAAMARDVESTLRQLAGSRRRPGTRTAAAQLRLQQLRQRLGETERLDFFGATGRDRVVALLQQLASTVGADGGPGERRLTQGTRLTEYRGRLWVTRPRPGIDRIASAWLIRRFIDPAARFDFVTDHRAAPADALPFDMSGVEFSHHGDHCTFETLCERFEIRDRGVGRIAAIVHDLDLKDDRFGLPEAPTIGELIQGLQRANGDDQMLLDRGMALFEALYRR
jgi:hypothetical protein